MYRIVYYKDINGKAPYVNWVETLDESIQGQISAHLKKLEKGVGRNQIKHLGLGLFEFRIHLGPGYRIYFFYHRKNIVLLLGGDKSSQKRDIAKVLEYGRKL